MRPERYARLQAVLDRRQPDLTVLMDRVHKAHNFSAIVRTGDAAGVLRMHAVPAERGLPVKHTSSAGSKKWVEVVQHDDVGTAISRLRGEGMQVLAAHLGDGALDYRSLDLSRPTAFLVGAELDGVSPRGLALADERVSIPMAGMVQSLNVSVAAALLLYEAVRQRERAKMFDTPRLPPEERARILFEWGYPRLARRLAAAGLPYPALDDDGGLPSDFARMVRRMRGARIR